MPEIFKFEIPEAYAEPINDGIKVTLIYPDEAQRKYTTERKLSGPADIEFGMYCLEGLLRGDRVRIGTPEHPSRPASGGILDVFIDGSFLSHRRNGGTKVHSGYNGIPSGFPSTKEDFDDIRRLQRREGAEESLVLDKEDNGRTILVPYDTSVEEYNILERGIIEKRCNALTLLAKDMVAVPVNYGTGRDILEIQDAIGTRRSQTKGNIYLSWEVETNVAVAGVRRWWHYPIAENVIAIDGEGFMKDGVFNYFNREKFHIHPNEVANVTFDAEIPMPKRYQLQRTKEGVGIPELVPLREGEVYHFKPDDGLRRMLDALKIPGWEGKWMQYEITEAEKRLRELEVGR